MEDYGRQGAKGDGRFRRKSRQSVESNRCKTIKQEQNYGRVRWNLQKKRRKSERSSAGQREDITLKLVSKHSLKESNHLVPRTLSDSEFMQQSIKIRHKQKPGNEENTFRGQTIPQNRGEYEHDEREQNILRNKKISNLRYIMSQTKQLMLLTESLILQEDCKKLKAQIMEEQINIRRLKIGLRKREKEKKVLAQYYDRSETKVTIKGLKSQRKTVLSHHSYSSNEYFQTETREQFDKQRKILLRARANSMKQYIQTCRQNNKIKQQLLTEEVGLMRKQVHEYNQIINAYSSKKSSLSSVNSQKLRKSMRNYSNPTNSIKLAQSIKLSAKNGETIMKPSNQLTQRRNQYMNFQ